MTLNEMLDILFPPGSTGRPTPAQEQILRHHQGPAWVLAGPGSGKSEVLTIMVLRLLYVEGDTMQPERVAPEAIFVTTFTEKAARNLEDRISRYRLRIILARPNLGAIDTAKLRIGTLHGLCNDLLQEFRATNYQNVRLMDEFEQSLFVYEQVSIIQSPNVATDHAFWSHFAFLFGPQEWKLTYSNLPGKWNATAALVKLFNRIVEDRTSIPLLHAAGGQWGRLADIYQEYSTKLQAEHRCDFAHLQLRFLQFLATPYGRLFKDGNNTSGHVGIRWVLVDEYQDTNLMQEEIYLTLANRLPYNLVVVGDDDQAMYRFRGGSVECMVTFDQACQAYLNIVPNSIARFPLVDNFRSHPQIVSFCHDYITSHPSMSTPGARVPGKPALNPRGTISGAYPAVGQLRAGTLAALADRFADTIRDLRANNIVQDYSQCCLLLRSTKETPRNAEPFVNALRARNIGVYNPRNKAFLEQEEVQGLLGAMLTIVDPQNRNVPAGPAELNTMVGACRNTSAQLAAANAGLAAYVAQCEQLLQSHPGAYLTATLQDIVYYVLALPPFDQWQGDPVRRIRLANLTALFESYSSMPVPGRPNLSRGSLRASSTNPGEVVNGWSRTFYNRFFGYLSRKGMDEEEDEDVICPPGMVPIMTMHQSKGLQFPFVFVGHMGANPEVSPSHRLETELGHFPGNAARSFTRLPEAMRAQLDLIRQYYVSYSRPEYALILMGTNEHFKKGAVPCGPNAAWIRTHTVPL